VSRDCHRPVNFVDINANRQAFAAISLFVFCECRLRRGCSAKGWIRELPAQSSLGELKRGFDLNRANLSGTVANKVTVRSFGTSAGVIYPFKYRNRIWNEFLFPARHHRPNALVSGWDVNTVVSIRSPKVSCIILKKYIHVFRRHESFSSISAISLLRRSP
jgi:hypothetical protein